MKKVLLALLLSTGVTFAGAGDDAANRVKTMQGLEAAMTTIQKGFLYNSESILKKGVSDFKDNVRNVKSFVMKLMKKIKLEHLTQDVMPEQKQKR